MTRTASPIFRSSWTALALLLGAAACADDPVHDLGYTNEELSSTSIERDRPSPPPVAESVREFTGVWLGEAEDPFAIQSNADDSPPSFRFPSGSRRIRLELRDTESGYRMGSLTFGSGAPPLPATDPDIAYPSVTPDFDILSSFALGPTLRSPVEGLPYHTTRSFRPSDLDDFGVTVDDEESFREGGRVIDGKLELAFETTQLFQSWCELQTPNSCPAVDGFLVDDEGQCFVDDGQTAIDCEKLSLCASKVCYCENASEGGYCTHSPENPSGLTLRLSDEGLIGLFDNAVFENSRGFVQPLGAVHFRRANP